MDTPADVPDNGEQDLAQLKAKVQKEMERRVETFKQELDALLKKYRVTLVPQVLLTGKDVQAAVLVQPLE